jgi:selenide,water dikinase
MTKSAAAPSKAMIELEANACTDITGFGLLGHAYEMAKGSDVTFEIDSTAVPLLPDVLELIELGMLTRGDKNNRIYVANAVRFASSVSKTMQSALFDPQTAGGLLISLRKEAVDEYLSRIASAAAIGTVREKTDHLIEVS